MVWDDPGAPLAMCPCGWSAPAPSLAPACDLLAMADHSVDAGCSSDDLQVIPADRMHFMVPWYRPARRLVKLRVGRTTGRRVPHVSCARTGHRSFRERKRQAARLCRCEFLRELQCGSRARRQREKQRRD